MSKAIILIISCLLALSTACKVSSNIFQTEDGIIVSQIAFVAEFSLNCPNNVDSVQYAEVAGKISPIVRIGDKYQVSDS
jgi:translocon-associated protein subunit delta